MFPSKPCDLAGKCSCCLFASRQTKASRVQTLNEVSTSRSWIQCRSHELHSKKDGKQTLTEGTVLLKFVEAAKPGRAEALPCSFLAFKDY